jgi:galactose mutarotase-like enzyme
MSDYHVIENDFLKVTVSESGAELQSIINKKNKIEYLWQGHKEVWGRRAPVLFPIVGRLYNDTYIHEGKSYKLSQHGFARDCEFDLLMSGENQLTFLLTENPETLEKYPFLFNLYINYQLEGSRIHVVYEVQNTGDGDMLFSIGGHPGFNCPLGESGKYEDYILEFQEDQFDTFPLNGNFQSGGQKQLMLDNKTLRLSKSLFENDAIIFKNNDLKKVTLRDQTKKTGIVMKTSMPYFGIWSPKNTDRFLCLEPWCGVADSERSTELKDKEGINVLSKGHIFKSNYEIEVL